MEYHSGIITPPFHKACLIESTLTYSPLSWQGG